MSRLVIVSNRVADLKAKSQTGGLAVGLADALRERGGAWFGWDGETPDLRAEKAEVEEIGNVLKISAPLTNEDFREYYLGYANSVLWPLFHYRLDLVDYRESYFDAYCSVNEYFASLLVPHLQSDDLIWVQDYHLIPFAQYLRKLGCRQRVGFFLHIPFPPPDMLAASPNHARLVQGLLEYDVVGFQTSTDAANFMHYLEEQKLAEVNRDGTIRANGRTITIDRYPIGIDVDQFRHMSMNAPEDVRIDMIRREMLGRKQVIGVDRLDYSKGLPNRFEAFERLIEGHPEFERKVSFLQIAPPSREDVGAYSDIRAELEELAGSINGRFADFNWTPLRYIHRSIPREKLAALFRSSSVGLVTPLRDGMNLVAKEFIAAQNDQDPGVLVLSEFAGAAEELAEAVIVNPYDIDGMTKAIYDALEMPLGERRDRQKALLKRIRKDDARAWLNGFLADLEADEETPQDEQDDSASSMTMVPRLSA